jgi:hypothetical protein
MNDDFKLSKESSSFLVAAASAPFLRYENVNRFIPRRENEHVSKTYISFMTAARSSK